jgi:hypothetical protein
LRLYLVIPGILFALAGFVFTLQGLGIVGPTSSFMFQNAAWVYQGLAVFLLGGLLILAGVWSRKPKKVSQGLGRPPVPVQQPQQQ